ncbi:MAG: GNAT family N-acetyltransferase, partial [Clostridia bacterium]|nr:GNAT family N-acetyltransferase [Clostridia bacterium]
HVGFCEGQLDYFPHYENREGECRALSTRRHMYKDYYKKYLGVKAFENQLVSSMQREIPLNKQYYYSVVVSEVEKALIYSVKPEWLEIFRGVELNYFNPSEVLKNLNERENWLHAYRTMYRMVYQGEEILETKAVVLTEDLYRKQHANQSEAFFEAYLKKNGELIRTGRRFWIYHEKQWAASGVVSDIDFNGGNIAVYTEKEFRKKGYGKEVVTACINWCICNNVLPVYLVDCHNTSSIALAKSLGFEIIAKEWILSEVK